MVSIPVRATRAIASCLRSCETVYTMINGMRLRNDLLADIFRTVWTLWLNLAMINNTLISYYQNGSYAALYSGDEVPDLLERANALLDGLEVLVKANFNEQGGILIQRRLRFKSTRGFLAVQKGHLLGSILHLKFVVGAAYL